MSKTNLKQKKNPNNSQDKVKIEQPLSKLTDKRSDDGVAEKIVNPIYALRKKFKWTQIELAEILQIDQAVISRIERDEREIHFEDLVKLNDFGINVESLTKEVLNYYIHKKKS